MVVIMLCRNMYIPDYSVLDNQGLHNNRMYHNHNTTLDSLLEKCNNDTICGSITRYIFWQFI